MFLDKITPKKFLCCIALRPGCIGIAILMICIQIIIIITGSVHANEIRKYYKYHAYNCKPLKSSWTTSSWRNAYGINITLVLYAVIILLINLWFIWGVLKKKKAVVMSWVMIMGVWLAEVFCLLIVMICVSVEGAGLVIWLVTLFFGLLTIAVLLYFVLTGYGYSLELKGLR